MPYFVIALIVMIANQPTLHYGGGSRGRFCGWKSSSKSLESGPPLPENVQTQAWQMNRKKSSLASPPLPEYVYTTRLTRLNMVSPMSRLYIIVSCGVSMGWLQIENVWKTWQLIILQIREQVKYWTYFYGRKHSFSKEETNIYSFIHQTFIHQL